MESKRKPPKAIQQYKLILQTVLESRPSGTRQRLATALGTNRSFVSQIANPFYKIPIPAAHINTMLEVCHFSPADRAAFLKAYDKAHPDQRGALDSAIGVRVISIAVPDMGDHRKNKLVEDAMRDMARNIARILQDK